MISVNKMTINVMYLAQYIKITIFDLAVNNHHINNNNDNVNNLRRLSVILQYI